MLAFSNWVLPLIDNHPQSRFDLQNHLKLLRGKLPTRIKRKTEQNSVHIVQIPQSAGPRSNLDAFNFTSKLDQPTLPMSWQLPPPHL